MTNVTIETGDLAGLAIADETVDAVVATLPRDELVAASQRLLYRSHLDGLYRYDDE